MDGAHLGFSGAAPSTSTAFSDSPVDEQLAASREVVERMAGMLDGLADTTAMVPRSEWTVGEHGAHIAFANIGFGLYALGAEYPYGDGTKGGLAEANETSLLGFPERDGTALAEHLRQSVETFAQVAAATPEDQDCPSPLGTMPMGVLTSYFLVHNLMHGCAIAAGLNRDFLFEPEHFPLIWPMVTKTLPGFVNATAAQGVKGCVDVTADSGFHAVIEMDNADLAMLRQPTGGVDCYVQAEPVHLFLVLIKMLTVAEAQELGHLKVSGSDPDLFARVMRALDIP